MLDRGRVRVVGGAGRTAHRIVAGPAVARLLIGSEEPAVLAVQSGIRFAGRGEELAAALFPKQWPALSLVDHF